MKAKRLTALFLAASLTAGMLLSGCGGVNPNATAATLDGTKISAGLMNFAAQKTALEYDTYYLSYYGPTMWTEDEGDGTTMEGSVREEVVDEVKRMYLLDAHKADYNVTVTEEDQKAIDAAVEEFFAENSADSLKKMGATKEIVKEYLRLKMVSSRMEEAIEETADTEVSDEEAAQRTFSYYKVALPEDESEEAEEEEAEEEEAEEETAADNPELTALAQSVAESAKTDFDGVGELHGQTMQTESYGKDESVFDATVIAAADALTEGQVSDLITGADGEYYVIRLDKEFDEEATENKKTEIVEERKQEKVDEVVNGYESSADWNPVDTEISKISFTKTYYQMAYDEVEDTEEAEEEAAEEAAEEDVAEEYEEVTDEEAE